MGRHPVRAAGTPAAARRLSRPAVAGRATWAVAYLPSCARRAGTTPGTAVRSVFHFLTDGPDRDRYRRTMSAALGPGARVVVGTFAEDGLELCSGLPTMRYGHAALAGVR